MKKITAFIIGLGLILNTVTFAEGSDFSDYVPTEKNKNLMQIDKTAARTFANNVGRNSIEVNSKLVTDNWFAGAMAFSPVTLWAQSDITNAGALGFYGMKFAMLEFEGGKDYVFSAPIKKTDGDNVRLGFALTNETADGLVYSNEYGAEGKLLGDGEETYAVTVHTADSDYSSKHFIIIGFPEGTKSGAAIELATSYPDSVYFGEEQAYDIKNTLLTDEDDITQGESFKIKAEVLNQVGIKGNTAQDMEFFALDESKTNIVSGFDFSTDENGITTVTVDKSVSNGIYSVCAQSSVYDGFRKSVTIRLTNADEPINPSELEDYVPSGDRPENLLNIDLTSARTLANNSTRNDTSVSFSLGSKWFESSHCFGPIYLGTVSGIGNAGARGYYGIVFDMIEFDNQKSYVFTLPIKKTAGESVKVGAALTNSGDGLVYSKEYGSGGAEISSEEQVIGFSLKPNENSDYSKSHTLVVGFPQGSSSGAQTEVDVTKFDNIYFGEEMPSDICVNVLTDKNDICQKSKINVKAEVVNQIGSGGNLNQTFSYLVLDENKTEKAGGFKVKSSADGSAVISIGENVPVGRYAVVAKSRQYDGFVKTAYIDVQPKKVEDIPSDGEYTINLTGGSEESLNVGDTAEFTAEVIPYSPETKFSWYAVNDNRNVTVDTINILSDGDTALVKIDAFSGKGSYYIIAEAETADGALLRASGKITVDIPMLWEYVRDNIAGMTKADLSKNMSRFMKGFGIDFVGDGEYDSDLAAEILLGSIEQIKCEADAVRLFERAVAVSLFGANPKNISLTDESGSLKFDDKLHMSDIDTDGVTVWSVYNKYLSDSAKKTLSGNLGRYKDFDEFKKDFALNTVLGAIRDPKVGGTGYIGEVLTKDNADLAGLDIPKYLSADDKSGYNNLIARKSYTAAQLESEISKYKQSTQGGGSSSGGGGSSSGGGRGTAATVPSTSSDVTVVKKDDKKSDMFSDVSDKHWAYADIYELKQRGILSGISENVFAPESPVTREQAVKLICEVFGYAAENTKTLYSDVPENAWYAPYIASASENSIINGIGDNTFGVGMPIKRQELCTVIYRCLGGKMNAELDFNDNDDIDEYAKEAVAYLSMYNIIGGFDDNTFRPRENCTRAQAAKIICSILSMKGVIDR